MKVALVFPHQLYKNNLALEGVNRTVLIEDHLYFSQYKFHKKKVVLHRASMKYYQSHLEQNNHQTQYFECHKHKNLSEVINSLAKEGVSDIQYCDTTDFLLEKRLKKAAKKVSINLLKTPTPNFFTDEITAKNLLKKGKEGYFMASFYKKQREHLNILIENGQPIGGQWSFDENNRKKLPKGHNTPEFHKPNANDCLKEAISYVEEHFSDNYGTTENFFYPITHYQAEKWLDDFLINRMKLFGDYEDAIHSEENFIYHSVLTPALNIGLLNPRQVIGRTLELHKAHNFPVNCLEGFIRQIIGWREFMRWIYEWEGVYERTNNHWQHKRKIPPSFWNGTTGIEPVDNVIKKVLETGYSHHIERLMVMGNFMLLCEFNPDEIYQWFMEMYIDAYDWVMVPNVYGMTQYADGGLITTKPYVSSSNYIRKMSNYKKGDWCEVWDGLYWRFIKVHEEEFAKNQRMNMMVSLLNRMDKKKLQQHIDIAEAFLSKLN